MRAVHIAPVAALAGVQAVATATAADVVGLSAAIIDMEAAHRHGARFEGSAEIGSADNLAMMADLVAGGAIDIPIARTYPLDCVREAYADLNIRNTHGKIVLIP